MFTDDIPRDWIGKEVGCYTQSQSTGPRVGKLLKIFSDSFLIEEEGKSCLYNVAFVQRLVLRSTDKTE